MPGFDGTGPLGQGPMTGRGNGYCVLLVNNGYYPYQGFSYRRPYRYINFFGGGRINGFYPWGGWRRRRGCGFGGAMW